MSALNAVLAAAEALHRAHPALSGFGPWPDDLARSAMNARHKPVADLIGDFSHTGSAETQPLVDAVRSAAGAGHWKRTYTEEEVGADFRARYGYYELFGPSGHFRSNELRGYIGYWGEGLHYDWHHHQAEELYFVLAGGAEFRAEGLEYSYLTPGESRLHSAWQPHAMETKDEPILVYVLWRGSGMADLPKMGRAT